ncbi:MAG: hypothetical protein HYV07_12415 [Deltaproteobacteria bacterium]|nr:hypothetical protein [Deltaproteobacteria bacterium]
MRRAEAAHATFGVVASLSAMSCGDASVLRVALPSVPPGSSLILAARVSGDLGLSALESELSPFSPVQITEGDLAEAFVYRRPLAALGLTPGPVPLARGPFSRDLERPDEVLFLEPSSDPPWQPRASSQLDLSAIRLERQCAHFDVEDAARYTMSLGAMPSVMLPLDEDRVVAVGLDGKLRLLDHTEAREVAVSPQMDVTSIAQFEGRLYVGSPSGVFAVSPSVLVRSATVVDLGPRLMNRSIHALAGGADELFGLHSTGVARLEPTDEAWAALPRRFDGLLWTAPGELLARDLAADGRYSLVRLRRGSVEELTLEPLNRATAWAAVSEGGPILGLDRGNVLQLGPNGEQTQLWEADLGYWVLDLAPYEQGFLLVLSTGAVGQNIPGDGLCPLQQMSATLRRARIVTFGPDILVAGEQFDGAHVVVSWIRRS